MFWVIPDMTVQSESTFVKLLLLLFGERVMSCWGIVLCAIRPVYNRRIFQPRTSRLKIKKMTAELVDFQSDTIILRVSGQGIVMDFSRINGKMEIKFSEARWVA
ncbi:unnamed protein product [Allacma fusca]|uniref:Uncharacterized protein n=1 Tax=Allacma fusca TaxID=39272 RepID=A0A8J2PLM0_9HEXA|nr:unnamed protein product [Allacma fusca]